MSSSRRGLIRRPGAEMNCSDDSSERSARQLMGHWLLVGRGSERSGSQVAPKFLHLARPQELCLGAMLGGNAPIPGEKLDRINLRSHAMSGEFDDSNKREMLQRLLRARGIGAAILFGLVGLCGFALWFFTYCRIEVPSRKIAVLTKKTGENLTNEMEIVTADQSEVYKGIHQVPLTEGRYFYNPWNWDWDIVDQVEVPENRLGVRIRLYGDDLSYGNLIATEANQKGIMPEVLRPGRHPLNAIVYEAGDTPKPDRDNFVELVELHKPVIVPAGYKGVVTLLSAPLDKDPNALLVSPGSRGVQKETLDPGVYYINPYVQRVSLVDCRSQRFNLNTDGEMGFPSRDGFWVKLDGRIEFRVNPEKAAEVFVIYNDSGNDVGLDAVVEEEIIQKIVLPNARSFCRLRGSDNSGRDFILGEKRSKFQEDFQRTLEEACSSQGIEIVQALITRISPPQQIALPVRERQIATQQGEQYIKEIEQQLSEQQLKIEQELVKQKQVLVEVEQEVVKLTVEAQRKQEVEVIEVGCSGRSSSGHHSQRQSGCRSDQLPKRGGGSGLAKVGGSLRR
jgi:regulator of protease activity HflC (stomatin/prohibitin superfamily)